MVTLITLPHIRRRLSACRKICIGAVTTDLTAQEDRPPWLSGHEDTWSMKENKMCVYVGKPRMRGQAHVFGAFLVRTITYGLHLERDGPT